jgi:hypothetical protein
MKRQEKKRKRRRRLKRLTDGGETMTAVTQWPRYHIGCMPRITSSSCWAEERKASFSRGSHCSRKRPEVQHTWLYRPRQHPSAGIIPPRRFSACSLGGGWRWVGRRVVPGPNGSNVTSSIVDQVDHLNQDTPSKFQYLISRGFMSSFGSAENRYQIERKKEIHSLYVYPMSLQWPLLIHQDHILP